MSVVSQQRTFASDDPNPGDVWVDNTGNPAGPGHEQDPHLTCSDITIWGAKLGDSGGTFTVFGWPPTGTQTAELTGSWSYNTTTGGTQAIGTISISALISAATAAGDAPVNKNGFHFKLVVGQDPRKVKVFWVGCAGAGGGGGSTPTPTETATPTPTPGGVGGGGGTPTPTPTATPTASVSGISSTPTPAAGAVGAGGVSAASTGGLAIATPLTGVGSELLPLAALLLASGLALFGTARKIRR